MTATAIAPELKEKTCTACNESWPADKEFFGYDRYSTDHLTSTCHACRSWSQKSRAAYGSQTKELSSLFAAFTQKTERTAQANS